MKKLLMVITLAMASVLLAQEKTMSLADARGKVSQLIESPDEMTPVMKQLSAADQVSFLSEVNSAISKMPGSEDERTAKFLDVNTAALKGAQDGNLTTLVAEVFATVPPTALTVINEKFASGLFNRAADPSKTYTDDQYITISSNVLAKVQERNASSDNAGVRDTFAILMLTRASNGSPEGLANTLADTLKDSNAQNLAKTEWIPPALGSPANYDPMLGASGAGNEPSPEVVLQLSHVQAIDALVGDLASDSGVSAADSLTGSLVPMYTDAIGGLSAHPRTMDPAAAYNPRYTRGDTPRTVIPSEPNGYPGQYED